MYAYIKRNAKIKCMHIRYIKRNAVSAIIEKLQSLQLLRNASFCNIKKKCSIYIKRNAVSATIRKTFAKAARKNIK